MILRIDPSMGMAGDMFTAALLGLGLPEAEVIGVMESAAESLGGARVYFEKETLRHGVVGRRMCSTLETQGKTMSISTASMALSEALRKACIGDVYAIFAGKALGILADAEEEAHETLDSEQVTTHDVPDQGDKAGSHSHHTEVHLHEAQDIVMDVVAAAWGLQQLKLNMAHIECIEPVRVGRGTISFSHGVLSVPAPATRAILRRFGMPWKEGPLDFEQLTPTGAAILAALNPVYVSREETDRAEERRGFGLGTKRSDPPNVLILTLRADPEWEEESLTEITGI